MPPVQVTISQVCTVSSLTFECLSERFIDLLGLSVYIIIALALVTFFYGIVLYISRSGDEGKRKEGLQYIFYGLIGLFVMLSVWGLVYIISGTFFGGGNGYIQFY